MNVGQFAYRIAYRILVWLRRTFQLRTDGVQAVVLRGDHVLLIRHSYNLPDRYMLPGGGIGRTETVFQAADREVMEETGCRLGSVRVHGQFVTHHQGWPDYITVVIGETEDEPCADGREIVEASFHPLAALPPNMAAGSGRRVIEVRDGLRAADGW